MISGRRTAVFLAILIATVVHAHESYDYCVVGAGPGGLQLARFLAHHQLDYRVFERASVPASFYDTFPRHRTLISVNKISQPLHLPAETSEYGGRLDWNSLLEPREASTDRAPPFSEFSREFFPSADDVMDYFRSYADYHALEIEYEARVSDIRRDGGLAEFAITVHTKGDAQRDVECAHVVLATGASAVRVPEHPAGLREHAQSYAEFEVSREHYRNKTVLILGAGNTAGEIAQDIMPRVGRLVVASRSTPKLAFLEHYVGLLRSINALFLDSWKLDLGDTLLEFDPVGYRLEACGVALEKVCLQRRAKVPDDGDAPEARAADASRYPAIPLEFDHVIYALGWRFDGGDADSDLFHPSLRSHIRMGKGDKFPLITADYQLLGVPGVFVAGELQHSADYKESSGGFIHGYRNLVVALAHILAFREHGTPWPHHVLTGTSVPVTYTDLDESLACPALTGTQGLATMPLSRWLRPGPGYSHLGKLTRRSRALAGSVGKGYGSLANYCIAEQLGRTLGALAHSEALQQSVPTLAHSHMHIVESVIPLWRHTMTRLREASTIYQMFDVLVDVALPQSSGLRPYFGLGEPEYTPGWIYLEAVPKAYLRAVQDAYDADDADGREPPVSLVMKLVFGEHFHGCEVVSRFRIRQTPKLSHDHRGPPDSQCTGFLHPQWELMLGTTVVRSEIHSEDQHITWDTHGLVILERMLVLSDALLKLRQLHTHPPAGVDIAAAVADLERPRSDCMDQVQLWRVSHSLHQAPMQLSKYKYHADGHKLVLVRNGTHLLEQWMDGSDGSFSISSAHVQLPRNEMELRALHPVPAEIPLSADEVKRIEQALSGLASAPAVSEAVSKGVPDTQLHTEL